MRQVLSSSWALLLGLLLLMLGNGIQGTLLGIRGAIEGFSTAEMSVIMSGYFAGFLVGAWATPRMIRRVGHVRVFAALGSFTSAVLVLYPTLAEPWAWVLLRVMIGFCFSGIYVTAESWLNNAVDNANRGRALSLYLIVQMLGIIAAQGLLVLGDPSGFVIFIIPSVLVSVSFAPILLTVTPSPTFATNRSMGLGELFRVSPLGCVGIFLLGGIFSALWGMASVYGTQAGFTVPQISAFIATVYVGGLVMQYPIGWLSDRSDRRHLILAIALVGGAAAAAGYLAGGWFPALLVTAFVTGGTANPLYALLAAYTNDHIPSDQMAGASGGLIFLNGSGAVGGPLLTGWLMSTAGPGGFWLFLAGLNVLIALYAAWRMRVRPGVPAAGETGRYVPISPVAGKVAVEIAQDVYAGTTSVAAGAPASGAAAAGSGDRTIEAP